MEEKSTAKKEYVFRKKPLKETEEEKLERQRKWRIEKRV